MTDNLLEKFEEKMMAMVAELESMRREVKHLRQDNEKLKEDKNKYAKKIEEILYLFDALDAPGLELS